ncbi:uncharacterized protein LACBIDRAFT_297896 [Laccaria bicolor S238N-H82]|uniref:Predicted protein n=1 Tax=Laccaria bicolor (strain S238N-H82 / ATCC MYA-4686) TaxID=486041 RepID=B0DB56_LACBS|nr:uncharacterized protein LACBIDRAFT_297896 [Laccaria bicolor S238N-H82]EDR08330.1 predicted protein [Laccaria bicolor S238N-H82]|eukprot:XP_001881400.1 predicted protein [Laccaria bicolor S238N-H82]
MGAAEGCIVGNMVPLRAKFSAWDDATASPTAWEPPSTGWKPYTWASRHYLASYWVLATQIVWFECEEPSISASHKHRPVLLDSCPFLFVQRCGSRLFMQRS